MGTCIQQGDLLYSANLHKNHVIATAKHRRKIGRGFGKMQVNGPEEQKLSRKKSLAVSVACMARYWPTPGFKGKNL